MRVLRKFRNGRFLLVEAEWKGERFIYLKDKKQGSVSLGKAKSELNLEREWESYLKGENSCLPCTLLLNLTDKVVAAGELSYEDGLTLKELETFETLLSREVEDG
ncbi:hypothetical protein Theam_1358 [Thermovibrio ammonificans HB-1]|uniref:Uncharacterized protein n=1 Tax=Thermovibrio ammonificans (strain DSM 15698 / JCM 12110 / HB-1) TaxID=648996 RepID=E8T3R4_THEA1|nr:hypothetical protein [Thermovibrio ammonificans]ADU97321.1 hypothetical protein Theam_1358 [Thermovibrio ammonificans HB-1]